ncbi:MAG: anti-sigma factor [Cyanobacteria bacterium Co-bin13]|nr:anti-sigma factor [Cyanobacteria bacterium Co-bin13]
MAGVMHSEELQLLIAGYVLCDLSPEEAVQFEQQLAANPALMAEVAQLQQALESTYDVPETEPPAYLRDAILTASEKASSPALQTVESVPSRPPRRHRRRWWGAAAAALVAGLSLSNYLLWQEVRTLRAASSRETAATPLTISLQPTDATLAASVTVAVDPNTLEGTLTVQDLPVLPPDQVYVLWTVVEPDAPFTTDDKDAILTQVFTVDAEGDLVENILVPRVYREQGTVTAVAVTIEDAAAPQRHVAPPILIERL